jgi:AraC-like DNA-binding protein
MSYEEENEQYRTITGERTDFYCIVSHPSQNRRNIRAMGIDAYKDCVRVGKFTPFWHQLVYITHGKFTIHYDNNRSLTANKGEVLLMPAGLERTLSAEIDAGWLWLHLEDEALYTGLKVQGVLKRKCPDGDDLVTLYRLLRQEAQGSVLRNSYIEVLCEKMQRLLLNKKIRPYENEFNELWQKVREMPGTPWSIDLICQEMKLSRPHLHKLCVSYFKNPPMEIISEIRLEYGAFLLKATSEIIDEIAYRCGFSSARSFSKSFLKKYAMRPGKFRKES